MSRPCRHVGSGRAVVRMKGQATGSSKVKDIGMGFGVQGLGLAVSGLKAAAGKLNHRYPDASKVK